MEKRWVLKEAPNSEQVYSLSKTLNIRKSLVSLLIQRGISNFEQAKDFFRPSLTHLHDPFLMKDMEKAVNRLCEAISRREKILIYGDYDVDGTTSVALVYGFLKTYTDQLDYYIPDRYTEGYGISAQGVRWASENGYSLLISLDCGIRAIDKADLAKELGIDLIICDHHLPGDELPAAFAILDTKQAGCPYPYKELSGCGVGFKLLQAFCIQNTIPFDTLFDHLDLVSLSIGADIVPITGENRVLAYYGLKKINRSPSPGLRALMEISGLKGAISISDLVFYVGPRINATGRLTHARESVKMLLAEREEDLQQFSEYLNQRNLERRTFDQSITAEALELLENTENYLQAKSTVLFKPDWHKGVIGIVASRCIESYYRPTIILTESKEKATGSARSVEGFDIHEAIAACSDLLEQFGGHTHAAGLTLPLDKVSDFQRRFEEVVASTIHPDLLIPKLEVDLEVDFDFVNFKTFEVIRQMAPFGPKNLQPLFTTSNVYLKNEPRLLKDEHLKLFVYQEGNEKGFDCIAFGQARHFERLLRGAPFKIAYHIDENNYLGNKTLQLTIKDIKFD